MKLNFKSKSGLVESHPGIINTDYVSDLFVQLQASKSNSVTPAKAVMDSLRVMQSYAGNEVGLGTGVMLDESGIYLTARHVVLGKGQEEGTIETQKLLVVNPVTGRATQASSSIIHAEADIALVYAPTGSESKPREGVSLSGEKLGPGQLLQMVGLIPGLDQNQLYIKSGTVNKVRKFNVRNTNLSDNLQTLANAQIAIDGMTPYGGTSGSPIIDLQGRIVGVESGFYTHEGDDPNKVVNYAGARIAPMSIGIALPSQPEYAM